MDRQASRVADRWLKQAEAADCEKDYQAGGMSYAQYQRCLEQNRTRPSGFRERPLSREDTQRAYIIERIWRTNQSDFLASLFKQVKAGRKLSPKQNEAILKYLRDPKEIALFGDLEVEGWKPTTGGGSKYVADDLLIFVSPTTVRETIKSRDIPTWGELTNDGEIYADDIPELVSSGRKLEAEWEKWKRQGWWPQPIDVKKWEITVTHRPTKKSFRAVFDTEREAKSKAEEAIPKLRDRKRPPWLLPTD